MNRELFSLLRGENHEVTFYGEIVAVSDGVEFATNDVVTSYPTRSLLKPFQFLAAGLPRENWVGEERNRYVAATGSISATKSQVEALEKWYSSPELKERIPKICFTPTYPMDEAHRVHLKEAGIKPQYVHHNCFSKHMSILAGCAQNGWSLDDYNSTSHPYHTRLMTTLSSFLGEDLKVETVPDGCLLPSPIFSLRQMAKLYQVLANPKNDGRLKEIRDLMLSDPEWVGGPGRFDTKLMQENKGKLIAKEGADGLLGIAILPTEKYPSGMGMVIKASSGYQPIMSTLALNPLLEAVGMKPIGEAPKGQTVRFHYTPFVSSRKLYDLSPLISDSIANWPGDVPFSRKKSLDVALGSHLTLSSIETSLHVGTHADAPNHCSGAPGANQGIGERELTPYQGTCQVLTVTKPRGSLIEKKDLEGKAIVAQRVLLRTESFPDPNKFNEDFVALTSDAVEWLADRKVCLVGIDTPSIDAFSSKPLPSHHATVKRGLSILEGIILTGVKDGVYEMSALPLKIKDGDASPVRVTLERIASLSPKT